MHRLYHRPPPHNLSHMLAGRIPQRRESSGSPTSQFPPHRQGQRLLARLASAVQLLHRYDRSDCASGKGNLPLVVRSQWGQMVFRSRQILGDSPAIDHDRALISMNYIEIRVLSVYVN